MIYAKYNLVCKKGHKHYSPTPGYWVGVNCGKPFGNPIRNDGGPRASYEKCMEPMHRLRKR